MSNDAQIEVTDYIPVDTTTTTTTAEKVGFLIFAGVVINHIVDEINITQAREVNNKLYSGADGSYVSYEGREGRKISFSNLCTKEEADNGKLTEYLKVNKNFTKGYGVMTCLSKASLSGNYYLTNFEITEDTFNNFTIKWEFTEYVPFNVTKSTFKVWGTPTTSSSTTKKTTTSSGISSTTKYLLTKCGTLNNTNKGTCVKYLQKFLQSKGYYKGYSVDGKYGTYTKKAVKSMQKKIKINTKQQTGYWNKTTRNYWRNKYKKYLTTTVTYKSTSKVNTLSVSANKVIGT